MEYKVLEQNHLSFLNQHVSAIYLLSNHGQSMTYHTVANGLIGLGVILSGKAEILLDNDWKEIPTFSIFGMINKPCQIRLSKGYKEIAIGFKPYHFNLFVREKLNDMSLGKITDATEVFNPHLLEALHEKLSVVNAPHLVGTIIEDFFKLNYSAKRENQRVLLATQMIYHDSIDKVDEIATQLSITPTTLRNAFREHIGVSPKELIKITRLYKAIQFQENQTATLTQLSYELGYFDQAHFIKEFKKYMGMAPKDYFKNKQLAFDFYNYGRWLSGNFV